MVVAIDVTQQTGVYPPRNVVTVSGLTISSDIVSVRRRVDGVETRLRGGFSNGPVTDTTFTVVDAEYPFGVPVVYRAVLNAVDTYDTSADTYALPGAKVALTDAITGLSVECQTLAWESRNRTRRSTRFRVSDRNIVVTGPLGQFESELSLFTETAVAADQMRALLAGSTQAIIQYRSALSEDYGNDCYMVVDAYQESRYSQDGTDERRIWRLQAAEVDAWVSSLTAANYAYSDVAAYYSPSGTYADLKADKATYLDVLTADWA